MQFYANKNRLPLKTILFFTVVLFIAYLPVSSFLFFLKNDAFTGYFPPKFFMSESIHSGYIPLWNPYINFGIPQYGDMSSGYWSPFTWLIASTVGYNAYSFTIETLLYILIGGVGMYKLTSSLQLNKHVCTIAAVAFICCGYNVGHLQHFNWLSGAAFLPWCFWSYQQLLNNPSIKNIVKNVLLFYMLVASAHPGITISAFYFFLAYKLFFLFSNNENKRIGQKLKQSGFSHLILLLLFTLLAAGMITGYLDILPHFSRSEKVSLADSLLNPTTSQSWMSVLFPFATVKNDAFFHTDVSMRNSYFSLTLLLFFLMSLFSKKTRLQNFLLFTGLFFLLLSTGGIFKTIAYKFIPFIGYIRLNGEFRIFSIFCFMLIAAIELDKFIKQQKPFYGTIKWIYYLVEIIVIAAIAFGIYKCVNTKQSIFYNTSIISSQTGLSAKLKAMIDAISFYDTLWIQGSIQLFLLWAIKWAMRFRLWSLLKKIVLIDVVIACLLNVPFTGAGKASVATIQQMINKSPNGIPVPKLIPINQYDTLPTEERTMIGDWSMYSKQPGTIREVAYPIALKNTEQYFKSGMGSFMNDFPFVFVNDSNVSKKVTINSFSPQRIDITAATDTNLKILVLQQNFYPYWYSIINNEKKEMSKVSFNFMSTTLNKGSNKITLSFEPTKVKAAMIVSLVVFIILCSLLVFLPRKEAK